MKITMSEQILIGNFGECDDQSAAAKKYAEIIERELTEYCRETYPDAELKFNLFLENASGWTDGFRVYAEENGELNFDVSEDIKNQYDSICFRLEKTGEIYE
jgi:hypothetical protein